MADRDITLWINERWYAALEEHFPGSVQEQMEELLDERINQLPQEVYERIGREIWQEEQRRKLDKEASRRFAVFKVTERGEQSCYLVDEPIEFLGAARSLRSYLKSEKSQGNFRHYYAATRDITPQEMEQYSLERARNTGRVTGAFEIDLDRGEIAALNIRTGWHTYTVKDVCAAAYHAERKTYATIDERLNRFLDRLDGKELSPRCDQNILRGTRWLRPEDVSFADEISEMDSKLNFYMESFGGIDEVFGTHVYTTENDDYVNVYADYDMERGEVADTLTVILHRGDGSDVEYEYPLTAEEKALLLPKMEAYCQQRDGITLSEYRDRYLAEQQQEQSGSPSMTMGQS